MPSRQRAVLLTVLAVALGLYLVNSHESPRELASDLRDTWNDLRGSGVADSLEARARLPRRLHRPLRVLHRTPNDSQ